MFSQCHKNKSDFTTRLIECLEKVRTEYNGDPFQLISAIPSKELWRFFIDGQQQRHGSVYKAVQCEIEESRSSLEKYLGISLFGQSPTLNKNAVDEWKRSWLSGNGSAFWTKLVYGFWGKISNERWYLSNDERKKTIGQLILKDCAWIPFEKREPNYLSAMYAAFKFVLNYSLDIVTAKNELSLEFVKKLHQIALEKTEDTQFDTYSENKKGEVRRCTSSFGMTSDNKSYNGIKELIKRIEEKSKADQKDQNEKKSHLTIYIQSPLDKYKIIELNEKNFDENKSKILCEAAIALNIEKKNVDFTSVVYANVQSLSSPTESKSADEEQLIITHEFNKLINRYNENIKKCIYPSDKLDVIIAFVQDSEQLHPFLDGNCRVLCMLLLNYLLMKNGFPPVILDDPNQFDGFSREELKNKLVDGMENVFKLLKNGSIYNIQTNEVVQRLSADEKKYFGDVIKLGQSISDSATNKSKLDCKDDKSTILQNQKK